MNDIKLVRISNVTNLKQPPGHFVDFAGFIIGAGKSVVVDLSKINHEKHPGSTLDRLETWSREGIVRVVNADDGSPITAPAEADLTRGTQFNEVAGSELPESDLEDFEEGFDPTAAKEATMPHVAAKGAHMPSTTQVAKASVTLSGEEGSFDNFGTSPIPGSKPRYVDNSEEFSVRAPRSHSVGGVVGKE